ncbi:MAG TPA: fibronectin type III domain-containing protein [Actinocrinis sp.]|nr:fibronectin type III domain-containing protein [Actinocrinis sp.]
MPPALPDAATRHPGTLYLLQPGCVTLDAHGKVLTPAALAGPAANSAPASKPQPGLHDEPAVTARTPEHAGAGTGKSPATSAPAACVGPKATGPGAPKSAAAPSAPAGPLALAPAANTVPGAPTAVTGVAQNGAVKVSWTAPSSNGGSTITSSKVTASPGGATATATGTATTATVTGLTNGTAYTFKVTSTNSVGTGAASSASAAVTPATVPGAPTAVTGVAQNAAVKVNWTAPASNGGKAVTSYKVTASPGGATATVTAPTVTATVTGLTNGTAYTFTVTATNAIGTSAASSPSSGATPVTVPGAPSGVRGTAGDGSAVVKWTAPSSSGGSAVTSYKVTASPGGATATVTAPTVTATITGLTNGTAYTFTVTATNAIGTGAASAASSPTTPITVPGAPTAVTGRPRDSAATVSWTAPANTGGGAITSYTVTANPGDFEETFDGPATTEEIFDLDNGTAYTFTVTAANTDGTGPASAASAAVTPQPATAPGPVTGLTSTAGNAQATFSWTPPANDGGADLSFTIVEVYRVSDNGSAGYADVLSPATSAVITGLTDGVGYYAVVYVENESYYSSTSVTGADFTPEAGPQPAPPAGVTATPGNGQATVTWTAPVQNGGSAITGYVITAYDESTDAQVGSPVTVSAQTTSTVVTGLTNGDQSYFGVSAKNANGAGPALFSSDVVSAGPPGAPTGVKADPSNGELFVSWTAPASNGGSTVTAYTVTVSGPSGPVAQQTSSTTTALVSGLADYTDYTATVTASNDVVAGAVSVPSTAVAPSAQDLSAGPSLTQLPPGVSPSDLAEQNSSPVMSGNGRYVFTEDENELLWRFDMQTGQKVEVSFDPGGSPVGVYGWTGTQGTVPISASYDGNVVAFVVQGPDSAAGDAQDVYVRNVSAGTTVLASPNAAGTLSVGDTRDVEISSDGSAVVFEMTGGTDMAQSSSCSDTSLYRFNVANKELSYVDPTPAIPQNLLKIGSVLCASPSIFYGFAISGNGDTISVGADLTVYCVPCDDGSEGELEQDQLIIINAGAGGASSAVWYSGLSSLVDFDGVYMFEGPMFQFPFMDTAGDEIDATISNDPNGRPDNSIVQINTAAPQSIPNYDDPLPPYSSVDALSGNGSIALGDIFYNDASGHAVDQAIALNIATGDIAVLSQIDGQVGQGDSEPDRGGIDWAGDSVALETNADNLLGLGNSPWEITSNTVLLALSSLPGLTPGQTQGCGCPDSLGGAGPVQDRPGDPVNTATGAFTETANDGGVPTAGVPFDFDRTYNSNDTTPGPLGAGWSEPYQASLSIASNGTVTMTAEDSRQGTFTPMVDGSYSPGPGVTSTLTHTSSGYTVTLPTQQTDTFDTTGRLTATADRSGQGLAFHYTGTQLTSVTDASGGVTTLTYNATSGLLTGVKLADGRSIGYGYNAASLLSSVTAVDGTTTSYGYDSGGRLTTITNPNGQVVTKNTYDSTTGRVTSQVTGDGADSASMSWNAATQVATYTAANGGVTTDYYAGNVLLQSADPDGGITSYTYDSHLNVTAVTDPDGATTTMTYDQAGQMLTRSAPASLGYTESWTYDGKGNVLTYTNGDGGTTTYTYDADNRVATEKDPAGATTKYTYNAAGQPATVTNGDSGKTTYAYNTAGDLLSTTDPMGYETTATYDTSGRIATETTPLGNVTGANAAAYTTAYTYFTDGDLRTSTDPLGNVTTYGYDPAGNLTSVTDPTGAKTTYTYDASGDVLTSTDPAGSKTTYTYDATGDEKSATDALGDKTTMVYDPAGQLASSVSPLGNVSGANPAAYTITYTYDGDRHLLSETDALGYTSASTYDALGRQMTSTDPLGRVSKNTYDADGNLTSAADAAGDTNSFGYDADGRRVSITDPLGDKTTIAYDLDGNELSSQTPLHEKTSWTYDPDGHVLTEIDPRGNATGATAAAYTTKYVYDAAGDLLSQTDPLAGTTAYGYNADGDRVSRTDPDGGVTNYTYNADNSLLTAKDPLGRVSTTAYTPAGYVSSTVDPTGAKTSYTYYPTGQVATQTAPDGNATGANAAAFTISYTYDADGNRTKAIEPGGAATTTTYDADDRALSTTDPDGDVTTTGYDADSETVSVTDPDGHAVTSAYDNTGRLSSNTDALGDTTTYGYDADGHKTAQTTPLGDKTTWTYDVDGQLTKSTDPRGNASGANPASFTTTYGFDAAGNQTSVTDPLGHTTATGYDADNRVASSTDALGNLTKYTYDYDGNLTKVTAPGGAVTAYTDDADSEISKRTDADGNITQYGYDGDGRTTSATDALGGVDTAVFDPSGNRTSAKDARGISATTTFNAQNQPTSIAYSDGTASVAYTYDPAGRAITQNDGSGAHTLGYDKDGRLTSVSEPAGGSFIYTYDASGNVLGRTYPGGSQLAYTYDKDGQQATQTAGGATVNYGYNADGELTTAQLPAANGYTETRTYDNAGRMTAIAAASPGGVLSSFQLTLNADGQPSAVAENRSGAASNQYYTYNTQSELASACSASTCPAGAGSNAYTYDPAGNRLTQSAGGTNTTYAYNADNQLTSATTGSTVQAYKYDADGNDTGNGTATDTVTYNAVNLPAKATQGTNNYTFAYDAQGDRTTTTDNGATVDTATWDLDNPLPQLAVDNSTAGGTVAYAYDPFGDVQSETTSAGTSYDTHDWLGSVTDLTSATGVDQIADSYTATGQETVNHLTTTQPPNQYGYAGSLDDPALSGLQDMRARQYDPATARFTSTDPVTQPTTDPYLSPYTYADGEPTALTDPSGDSAQVPSGYYLPGSRQRHDFAVQMSYDQLSTNYGANNVYADLGAAYYGPIGKLLALPGAGRNGGGGQPDLVVRQPAAPSAQTAAGAANNWLVYEVKPATEAGEQGVVRNGIEYNGDNMINQLGRYLTGMRTAYPGAQVNPGPPVTPESAYNAVDQSIEAIFSAPDWASYASAYASPVNADMDGIIFYTNFKPTRNKVPSKQFPKALPTIKLLMQESGSDLSVDEFLDALMDGQQVAKPTCQTGADSGATNPWLWPAAGGAGALGAGGYYGYQFYQNRLPDWLSDDSINEFLDSQGVPDSVVGGASGDLGFAGLAAEGGELIGGDEILDGLLMLAFL